MKRVIVRKVRRVTTEPTVAVEQDPEVVVRRVRRTVVRKRVVKRRAR